MYQHPTSRPRYLNLKEFKFPLNAKISILHRISGVALIISLIGYLALLHLIILHPIVTLESVSNHCIVRCLSTVFWITLSFHWLSGVKHLLAEHYTDSMSYQKINSDSAIYLLLAIWGVLSVLIIYYFWFAG